MRAWDGEAGVPVGLELHREPGQSSLRSDPADAAPLKHLATLTPPPPVDWRTRMADRARRLATQASADHCSQL